MVLECIRGIVLDGFPVHVGDLVEMKHVKELVSFKLAGEWSSGFTFNDLFTYFKEYEG